MAQSANGFGHFQSRFQRRARPGMFAVVLSFAIHAGAIGAAAYGRSGQDELEEFKTYRVKIYSPPPQVEGPPQPPPPTPEPAIKQPDPKPKAVEEPKPKAVEEKPRPKAPEKPKPKPEAPKPSAKPASTANTGKTESKQPDKPVVGPNARPDSPGGENINVDIAGAEFPFPEYLQNIILQMGRYFRWTGACTLTARVSFYIREDGSVQSPRVLKSSGNREFDRAILRGLDMIDKAKAFGPLPETFALDRLPVAFTFDPPCANESESDPRP